MRKWQRRYSSHSCNVAPVKMLLKLLILLTAVITISAEPPIGNGLHRRHHPYPASGWRPRVPFNLPGEYLPPVNRAPTESTIEITKERVEHAGQVSSSTTTFQPPQTNYLPPTEQGLPSVTSVFEPFGKEQQKPAPQYGAPRGGSSSDFTIIYPDNDDDSAADSDQLQQPEIKEGQYYIVSDDNKLQRVIYRTALNPRTGNPLIEQEEGFTAQLKYSTIGELQDPVYRYNNEGQLVRILK